MKKLLSLVLTITASVILSVSAAFATDHLVADFDGGGWGGAGTWVGSGGEAFVTGGVESGQFYGPTGNAFRIVYSGVDASGKWAGGVLTGLGEVDVSTYTALSFWIYTSTPALDIGIQAQDSNAQGDAMGKVRLTDYLISGTSVWQNVIIPLDAFKRDNANLKLIIKEVKWMAEYDSGHNATGAFYIDDISFLITAHAPARSRVISGTDKWIANTSDAPGDTLMTWDMATSSVTSNEVNVLVSTGSSIGWASIPADKYTMPGTTVYFSYQIVNMGNAADDVKFSSAVVVGSTWPIVMYWDKDKSGTMTSGDLAYDKAVNLLPDGTHYLLLGVYVPPGTELQSQTTVQLTAKDDFGSGVNDSWPTVANDDTITDMLSLTVSGPILSLMKSTDTAVARPNDTTVLVTLTYNNTGNENATNLTITEALPFNAYLAAEPGVDPGMGSADAIEYYVGGAWQGAYSVTATKIRWTDSSVPTGGADQTVSYKIKVK